MMRWTMIFGLAVVGSGLLTAAGCGGDSSGGTCAAEVPASCPSDAPSYKTDVAPILQAKCVTCHSPTGQESGRPFDTYAGVQAEISEMKNEISNCEMPPAGSGELTAAEANTILSWIVCGGKDD